MDHKFDHVLGPGSEPFVFPRVSGIHTVRGSMSYYWGDDKHLSIIWPPYKGFETNWKRKFFISNRKELDPEPEVLYFSCEMDDKSGIIRIWPTDYSKYGDPESGLDIGYPLETTSSLIEQPINRGIALLSIGSDSSVNAWSRREQTSSWSLYSDASVVAPAGSALTHGGGCLAVCGETPTKEFRKHRDPIIWWLGPRGEVFGRRLVGDSEHWVDVGPKASHPAGSVDVSQSLKRPAQIATAWSYDLETNHRSYLFWVRSNGDMMTTCLHDDNPGQTAVAYQNIDAAPGISLTAFIGAGRQSPDKVKVYVLWISATGGVLKQFYTEIRSHGCKVCGSVDFGNGC
ncbi:hypothetical protein FPANT_12123 [Fusarium pseudoanthophilum]|uniref:Fucose-specific lectin n=1 Tax=Fusarium pseudoanthophilum TaxID=48495 RepID=A0A8H5KGH1_9HYPO|nr:hypothetical protein FPANT_12123 [Fusarium pseudoanthophilum]